MAANRPSDLLTISGLAARSGAAASALRFYESEGMISASTWQATIDARIAELQLMSSTLTSCIGCGCLSLRRCALYNPQDTAAGRGQGARWLLGDEPPAPPGQPAGRTVSG